MKKQKSINSKATDYIFINKKNKTLPFGVEYYITQNYSIVGLEYIGFANVNEAIEFIENNDLIYYKQK